MVGVDESLRSGGVSARERELARENDDLRTEVTSVSIDKG